MKNNSFMHLIGKSSFLKDDFKIHVSIYNKINNNTKVVYLFHGMGNDEFKMSRKIDLNILCQKYNLIIITPFVDKSFSCNTLDDNNYFNFVEYELLDIVKEALRYNLDSNDKYIIGASMGAYGALKLVLNNRIQFKGIGLVSGCFDLKKLDQLKRQKNYKPNEYWQQTQNEWTNLFGNSFD
ncbi:MAG: alpha/beta hydrolase-fold protein, partial [Mycoplasmatales bacterium]